VDQPAELAYGVVELSDVVTTRLRRSNYDLEAKLGIPLPAIPFSEPSVHEPPTALAPKPELKGWLPVPKSPAEHSWIRCSKLRRHHINFSIEVVIPPTDITELNDKAAFVKSVWEFCANAKDGVSRPTHRARRLAKAANQQAAHITYNFDLAYLVCRTYLDDSGLIEPTIETTPEGWVPFHKRQLNYWGDSFRFGRVKVKPVFKYPQFPEPLAFCDGSFNRDAMGRWYLDTSIRVDVLDSKISLDVKLDPDERQHIDEERLKWVNDR
jgi:hypothetical protein